MDRRLCTLLCKCALSTPLLHLAPWTISAPLSASLFSSSSAHHFTISIWTVSIVLFAFLWLCFLNPTIRTHRFSFVNESENLELKKRVVLLHELPPFCLFYGLEIIRQHLHALDIKIRRIAEPSQLEYIHHILDGQTLTNSLWTHVLQLWDQVHVWQRQ